MKTLTFTQDQADAVYNALREAYIITLDKADDIKMYPEEFESEDPESVQKEITMLQELIEKFV